MCKQEVKRLERDQKRRKEMVWESDYNNAWDYYDCFAVFLL
jgi:hypothetical protein